MRHLLTTLLLLALSSLSGLLARSLGLPLPFMIGPLILTGIIATALPERLPEGYKFPPGLRIVFISVIGLMIGAQVTAELLAAAPRLMLSFAALTLFTVTAHAFNYTVFRRIGGYDRATAFYAATPGGLYESIALGEEAITVVSHVLTMHVGPSQVLLNMEVQFRPDVTSAELFETVERVQDRITEVRSEIKRIFLEIEAMRGVGRPPG